MHDPNRALKWFLIVTLVVLSLIVLYPPERKLKGGIDLVGGTSLLFEIDTTGLTDQSQIRDLSTRIMGVLKERVDPRSQLNLEWRPIGHTRLEIRMPRPPAAAIARRQAKEAALEKVESMSITRLDVEKALNRKDEERGKALEDLVRGVPERTELIRAVETAFLAQRSATASRDPSAMRAATESYEKAMSELLATSLQPNRFRDILGLPPGPRRVEELERIRGQFPAYDAPGTDLRGEVGAMTAALKAYDAWSADKTDLEDPADLKRRIRGAGVLEFRILADRDATSPDRTAHPTNPLLQQSISGYVEHLQKYGPRPRSNDRYRWFPVENVQSFLYLDDMKEFETVKDLPGRPIVEEYAGRYYVLAHSDVEFGLLRGGSGSRRWSLQRAFATQDPMSGRNVVSFKLDTRGGIQFRELTGKNVNRQLCIMLDDSAMSSARIEEAIGESGQIRGDFTMERVRDLVNIMEAGSLPARLKETPLAEKTIGPSLGQTNREKGVRAAAWGGLGVVIFVLFYYGLAGGGVANLALVLNLLFTLAIMSLMQATFTLPGIAGVILTVGMAIDANVLIFERIREERNRGVPFKKAVNAGYDKAFSAILDGNVTTLITCVILGFVGSEEIKGFAITLGLGLVTSMFTALTVTRLIYNTLIDAGILKGFSMRKLIGVPAIDWVGMRKKFWAISAAATVSGVALFLGLSVTATERIYDIEFLGGTSVQIDLKKEFPLTDEEVTRAITSTSDAKSAVSWLNAAADRLVAAKAADGETPGQFTLTSDPLTADEVLHLTRVTLEPFIAHNGFRAVGLTAIYESKPGMLTLETFREKVNQAATSARQAADRLRRARVQTVGEIGARVEMGSSYEIVTTETNRGMVQAAILAALGGRLSVQQAVSFTPTMDEELTRQPFFVIESEDEYLSDVIATDANYDIKPYRGGVAIDVRLPDNEEPLTKDEFKTRLRQVGLTPEFEQFRSRDPEVFELGAAARRSDGQEGYRRFAVCAVDDTLHYDDDPVQWAEQLAKTELAQVEAALGSERSLSKVVQFNPQIAGQTTNKAVFGLILAFIAIAVYVWLRFGTQDYGLAVLVALVHDVAITVGALGLANLIFDNPLSRMLLIEDFKVDLPVIAAVLTIIGYSLNDTIVVFDRIRENKGRSGSLSASMINMSINQTLSRTVLTSLTVFVVVFVLYVFGGTGIHGFAYAMLVGVLSGTYSTVAVAVPFIYQPRALRATVSVVSALALIGIIALVVPSNAAKLILSAVVVVGCAYMVSRTGRYLRPDAATAA